ncbi:MAG TPA: Lrp/AsnC family transcriptional regulator [Micropepsaceae bacterium]|nr:Lrp/AsnC family transcriptional regulator [Micropepsaceae bacterium]
MTELTEQDIRLLALLDANAREPVASLARKLKLARSTVQERIERLERRGVIAGYAVRRGRNVTENLIRAHVMISGDPRQGERIVAELKKLPEVRALSAVSGAYDMIAMIEAETTGRIDAVLDRIGKTPGVARTMSSIILSVKFER